ncbi:uncharacterized protein LOC107493589 isoform X1 [Arachis duranensis]|uniref:Uncharacterized protein LOC107493589 isoform X1 n=2 Tax=Arachis duranensis TaxID=130453 RepID=A0A6P5M766_ARADU|nr:uncharacterized protein LOC107493589 isoform X1 [Arachis duranensis]
MREEEVTSIATKPSLEGLGSPSLLSCASPLVSGSPLCFCCNSPLSWHSMSDPSSTYRTCDEISNVRQERDLIERVRKLLLAHGIASEKEMKDIEKQVRKDVDDAIAKAKENHVGGQIKLKVKILTANFREDELVDMMINLFATYLFQLFFVIVFFVKLDDIVRGCHDLGYSIMVL